MSQEAEPFADSASIRRLRGEIGSWSTAFRRRETDYNDFRDTTYALGGEQESST
jgi:hypothetical protein